MAVTLGKVCSGIVTPPRRWDKCNEPMAAGQAGCSMKFSGMSTTKNNKLPRAPVSMLARNSLKHKQLPASRRTIEDFVDFVDLMVVWSPPAR